MMERLSLSSRWLVEFDAEGSSFVWAEAVREDLGWEENVVLAVDLGRSGAKCTAADVARVEWDLEGGILVEDLCDTQEAVPGVVADESSRSDSSLSLFKDESWDIGLRLVESFKIELALRSYSLGRPASYTLASSASQIVMSPA